MNDALSLLYELSYLLLRFYWFFRILYKNLVYAVRPSGSFFDGDVRFLYQEKKINKIMSNRSNNFPKNKKFNNRKRNKRVPIQAGVNSTQQLENFSHARLPRGYIRLSPYPPEMTVRCTYTSNVELFSGVNGFAVKEFSINNVRVPDPAVTDEAEGYSFWSQIYRLFRVTNVQVRYRIANLETVTPVSCAFIMNDTQPSTFITTYQTSIRFGSAGFTTGPLEVGGNTGSNLSRLVTYKSSLGNIIGNQLNYYAATTFAGSDAAGPTQTVWGAFLAYTYDPTVFFADGLAVNATFIMTTRFYSLRPV